jgi:glutaconate CoA-transferase subunit A
MSPDVASASNVASGANFRRTESLVTPYAQLRKTLASRDRSLRRKVMSLEEATAFVQDGDTVGIGGSTMSRTPMGMIWALIRARKSRLSCIRSIVSSDGDLLYGSGICERITTSWFSQGILWGVSKVMRHHVEAGAAIYDEWSHMAIGMRFRAGAMGLPFLPIRSMLGSDVVRQRPETIEMICPYTRDKLLLVPAVNPDVALIHVQRCDEFGNAQIDGLPFMDLDLAMAANRVILTTERIVSNDQIRRAPDHTKIPFFAVDAVVELPYGCAPHECSGVYEPMMRHMESYVAQVNANPVGGLPRRLRNAFAVPASRSSSKAESSVRSSSLAGSRPRPTISAARRGRTWCSAAPKYCSCCKEATSTSASWAARRSINLAT